MAPNSQPRCSEKTDMVERRDSCKGKEMVEERVSSVRLVRVRRAFLLSRRRRSLAEAAGLFGI